MGRSSYPEHYCRMLHRSCFASISLGGNHSEGNATQNNLYWRGVDEGLRQTMVRGMLLGIPVSQRLDEATDICCHGNVT